MRSSTKYIIGLCLIWAVSCLIVNPVGEFMINDDYAFVTSLEKLINEGRLGSTGKGPAHASGGPSLVTHLAWGYLFTKLFGYSLTVLRLSVCVLGLLGIIGIFLIIRSMKLPDWLCFLASLTLMFNPLYFSQSFTFMTDITFISLLIFSIFFLKEGIDRSSGWLVVTGLVFSLAGILTRQLAIIIPAAFIITCMVTAAGTKFGRVRSLLLTSMFVVIPWLGFEWFLSLIGSSPITKHEKLHDLLSYPFLKGFPDYPLFVLGQFAQSILGYTAFMVSPLVAPILLGLKNRRSFSIFALATTAIFIIVEILTFTGVFTPPVLLSRNVIYNFGIGPVLLKDSYLLGIPRTWTIPPAMFYVVVWWTVLCLGALLMRLYEFLSVSLKELFRSGQTSSGFISVMSIVALGGYCVIVILTDLHDRYIIPVCVLTIVWICSVYGLRGDYRFSRVGLALAGVPLIAMMIFSVLGTRDFLEVRRTVTKANHFVISHLKARPCDFDGGFEFNGYHCYDMNHEVKQGHSWWWVKREDYVVTLGPLEGYRSVAEFPFTRILGPNGKVNVLKPIPD